MTSPDGKPVNAVRGLLDFIARLVTDRRPTRLVACIDADWRPAFRVAAIPSYKRHRVAPDGSLEIVPDNLVSQIPVIEQVLDAFGLAQVGVAGFEADDVIGTLAARADVPTEVVTGDRDLFQVVDDAPPGHGALHRTRCRARRDDRRVGAREEVRDPGPRLRRLCRPPR